MKPVPPPPEVDPARWAGLARRLRLAWAALLWERLWPLLLPPICVGGLFVAFALFDLAPLLPPWLHGLVLAATAGGIAFLLVRCALRLELPDMDDAARRLERDSGLEHRPLAVLGDRPAVRDDPVAHALWLVHLRRAADRIQDVRLVLPRPGMAARDPWGLRAAVLLLLVIAATGARDDAFRRVVRALTPQAVGLAADVVEVWITPPAYTNLAPILLKPGTDETVAAPVGSVVMAVLSGGWGSARLHLADHSEVFQRQSDGSQRIEARLERSGRLAVRQSLFTVASWNVQAVADAPPSVAFAEPPQTGDRGRLRLAVGAADDYGLAHLRVQIGRASSVRDGQPPLTIEMPLPAGQPRSAKVASWFDLTAHPWAGLSVVMRPQAEDASGQTTLGDGMTITLPQRRFVNPVAAAVAEQRRALMESTGAATAAVGLLDRIATEPGLFNDDLKTFLMLRAARHALDSEDGFDLDEVQGLMWQAALRIEDGDLSSAERALDEARQAVEQALERGASNDELRDLIDRFQQALERFTQALAERGETPEQAGLPQDDARVIGEDELRQMVDSLREMAESGARDAMRQMLAQMGQILDGLRAGGGPQAGAAAQQGLGQLRELARRQQELLDDSHRRGTRGEQAGGTQAAQAQESVRRALAEVGRKLAEGLGEVPTALQDADGAMASAADELGLGRWNEAAEAQGQALTSLQQAARQALAQMTGQGMQGTVPRDPLGRPQRGAIGDDGTTRVPDRAELQRSRQLLEEIRRRAGETQRPEPEKDYLKRLLRQF